MQVLGGGAVVQRQAPRTALYRNAEVLECDLVAVDPLVAVLRNEEVIRAFGHQSAKELPVSRRHVLPLVDEYMIGQATLSCLRHGIKIGRGDGGDLLEIQAPIDVGIAPVRLHHLPHGGTLCAAETDSTTRAANSQIVVLGGDPSGQDHLGVFGFEESRRLQCGGELVSELVDRCTPSLG